MTAVRRRELLAGIAGAATGATAGCTGRVNGGDEDNASEPPISVETLDAPGSAAGTVTVPEPPVTFVEFFATTCSVCAAQMSELRAAYRESRDVGHFLSVTSEPVGLTVEREEVVSWWADHGGTWPVAVDDGTALARRYDATSVPKAVVLRPDGTVAWEHTGRVAAGTIVDAIRTVAGENR